MSKLTIFGSNEVNLTVLVQQPRKLKFQNSSSIDIFLLTVAIWDFFVERGKCTCTT